MNPVSPPRYGCTRWLVWCWLALPWTACSAMPASASAPGLGITEVVLERDCSGCASGTRLVLQLDGTATFTEIGKARRGTQDQTRQGRIEPQAFEALAMRLQQAGVHAWAESYDDPQLQDGAWAWLRVVRAGVAQDVFLREDAAPPEWRAVETAIDQLLRQLFSPR